jgi:hypothetical protein
VGTVVAVVVGSWFALIFVKSVAPGFRVTSETQAVPFRGSGAKPKRGEVASGDRNLWFCPHLLA